MSQPIVPLKVPLSCRFDKKNSAETAYWTLTLYSIHMVIDSLS